MEFRDEVIIKVIAGNGGNGLIGWHREKFIPFGGPDGGDGGDGGAVILLADPGLNNLIDYSYNPLLRASHAASGGDNKKSGRNGKDLIRRVPLGTQVFYQDRLVADLSVPAAKWIAARGGKGGKGNAHFKSSTNQAPDLAQLGGQGESFEFKLVLKSVADVGLLGLPNVGKSTLISSISEARPKIANYPFTTLRPNLGVVHISHEKRFVMADIPGLIPGAHKGKGLGIDFLKHIERTVILLHLLDTSEIKLDLSDEEIIKQVTQQYQSIEQELFLFSEKLLEKPRIVVFSKGDLPGVENAFQLSKPWFLEQGFVPLLISSHSGLGISEMKNTLYQLFMQVRAESDKIIY